MYRDLDIARKHYNNLFNMSNFSQKLLISTMKESGKIPKETKYRRYYFKELKLKDVDFYTKKLKVEKKIFKTSFEVYENESNFLFREMFQEETKSFIDKDKNGVRRYSVFVKGLNAKTEKEMCYGIRVYADGRIEEIHYIDETLNDNARIIYQDGTILIGNYKNGLKNGKFTKTTKKNNIFEESYVNGKEDGYFSFPKNDGTKRYIGYIYGELLVNST